MHINLSLRLQFNIRLQDILSRLNLCGITSESNPTSVLKADQKVYGSTSSLVNARPIRTLLDPIQISGLSCKQGHNPGCRYFRKITVN